MAWRNSLAAMANALQLADLRDQGILVELKLPLSSKRLDVLATGSNPDTRRDHAVVVELKQWTEVEPSNITDCVVVNFGGRELDHLHPSRQVERYQRYLQDTHPAFTDGGVGLDACAYLHFAKVDEIDAAAPPAGRGKRPAVEFGSRPGPGTKCPRPHRRWRAGRSAHPAPSSTDGSSVLAGVKVVCPRCAAGAPP